MSLLLILFLVYQLANLYLCVRYRMGWPRSFREAVLALPVNGVILVILASLMAQKTAPLALPYGQGVVGTLLVLASTLLFLWCVAFESFPSCRFPANRFSGIYRVFRHPSYFIVALQTLGYSLALESVELFFASLVSLFLLRFFYQQEEREKLMRDPSYGEYLTQSNLFWPKLH